MLQWSRRLTVQSDFTEWRKRPAANCSYRRNVRLVSERIIAQMKTYKREKERERCEAKIIQKCEYHSANTDAHSNWSVNAIRMTILSFLCTEYLVIHLTLLIYFYSNVIILLFLLSSVSQGVHIKDDDSHFLAPIQQMQSTIYKVNFTIKVIMVLGVAMICASIVCWIKARVSISSLAE